MDIPMGSPLDMGHAIGLILANITLHFCERHLATGSKPE